MSRKQYFWLFVFGVALGFFESAVVIYLRKLYYPEGFAFPLALLPSPIGSIELLREACTIIILLSIGIVAGKNTPQRLAVFLALFAIWDLTYYLFLKIFLDWPSSWMTWDILFLIPVPWVGPVIMPCLLSVLMLVFAAILLWRNQNMARPIQWTEWGLLTVGSLVVIGSWTWDFLVFASDMGTETAVTSFVPHAHHWIAFAFGLLILIGAIARYCFRREQH